MRFSFLIVILFFSSFHLHSQNGWNQQYVLTGYFFSGIQFFGQDTGYVSGYNGNNSIILKTTNSGNNWNTISTITNSRFRSIYFKNQTSGWACGSETSLYEAAIYRTTNSGVNWILQMHDAFWDLNDITFSNDTTAWTVGWSDETYKSTNTGNNWFAHSGLGGEANDIFFLNSQYGWVANGGESGSIVRTTNGGINWNNYIHMWTGYNSVNFIDQNTGWAVGYYNDPQWGVVSRTTNGGVNWAIQTYNYLQEVKDVYFSDSANGWIIAVTPSNQTFIFRSYTGGITWLPQTSNIPYVSKLYFINLLTGWAVGNAILKTTTGGITEAISAYSEIPQHFLLHQNYPNPFNPSTKIRFEIPADLFDIVRLRIFDILGREVRSIVNENLKPGIYEAVFNGVDLPSGAYFYQLSSGEFTDTKKMILVK